MLKARLREFVIDAFYWQHVDATWNYTVGCILGELSGQLFPETERERQEWEEECQKVLTWENKRHEKVLGKVVLQEK